ncbi:MAG TPA: hypothetical protein VGS79_23555 [Puia sp.]|nr:hypothetical protein [Puia sp.]
MKHGYLLILAFFAVVMIYACVKSSTSKKAQLSLESITRVVNGNDTTGQDLDSMTALFKFTNNGGTLGNGTFVSIRTRINQLTLPQGDTVGADTLYSTIPDFGGVSKGEFKYVLDAQGYLSQNFTANDTFVFKFYALTPDSLSSDTVTSPPVVITKS